MELVWIHTRQLNGYEIIEWCFKYNHLLSLLEHSPRSPPIVGIRLYSFGLSDVTVKPGLYGPMVMLL